MIRTLLGEDVAVPGLQHAIESGAARPLYKPSFGRLRRELASATLLALGQYTSLFAQSSSKTTIDSLMDAAVASRPDSKEITPVFAQGSFLTIRGHNLSLSGAQCVAPSPALPDSLCGASVEVDGTRAGMHFAGVVGKDGSYQVNFQAPMGAGPRTVTLVGADGQQVSRSIEVVVSQPEVFAWQPNQEQKRTKWIQPNGAATYQETGDYSFFIPLARNVAAALRGDYKVHGPSTPIMIPASGAKLSLANVISLYFQGISEGFSKSDSLVFPADRLIEYTVKPRLVLANSKRAVTLDASFVGGAPGLGISQGNFTVPAGVDAGAYQARLDLGGRLSAPFVVFLSSTGYGVNGFVESIDGAHPGLVGVATVNGVDQPLVFAPDGSYLVDARRNDKISVSILPVKDKDGSTQWVGYRAAPVFATAMNSVPGIQIGKNRSDPSIMRQVDYTRIDRKSARPELLTFVPSNEALSAVNFLPWMVYGSAGVNNDCGGFINARVPNSLWPIWLAVDEKKSSTGFYNQLRTLVDDMNKDLGGDVFVASNQPVPVGKTGFTFIFDYVFPSQYSSVFANVNATSGITCGGNTGGDIQVAAPSGRPMTNDFVDRFIRHELTHVLGYRNHSGEEKHYMFAGSNLTFPLLQSEREFYGFSYRLRPDVIFLNVDTPNQPLGYFTK